MQNSGSSNITSLKERFSNIDNLQQKNQIKELWKLCFLLFNTKFEPEVNARKLSIDHLLQNFKKASIDSLSLQISSLKLDESTCRFYYQEFWDLCGSDDPDTVLLRFLFARKFSLTDAFQMLVNCIVWRGYEFKTTALMRIGESGIKQSLLQSGEVFFRGTDFQNRLVVYINVSKHDKSGQTLEEGNKFIIYIMELGRLLITPGTETFTIIFNMTGFAFKNMDLPSILFTINSLSSYYPESLGSCLIVNAPFIFKGFFKIIKEFLDPVVISKIKFIKSTELSQHLSTKFIPVALGGDDIESFSFVPPPTVPHVFNDEKVKELELVREQAINNVISSTRKFVFSDGFDLGEDDVSKREKIIENFRQISKDYFYEALMPTLYHRLGILTDRNRSIDWDKNPNGDQ